MSFKYGATVYPLAGSARTTLLPVCDPALGKILDFLAFCLDKYAGDVFISNVSVPMLDLTGATVTKIVTQVAPINPDTIAKAEQWQFPLFCGWNESTVYSQQTINWAQDVRMIGLAYILAPLTAMQSIAWTPMLNSVSEICNRCLRVGNDVDYNNKEAIYQANGITLARLKDAHFGAFKFSGEDKAPLFPAWMANLELTMASAPDTDDFEPLEGADVAVSQQATDEAVPVDIVTAKTEVG